MLVALAVFLVASDAVAVIVLAVSGFGALAFVVGGLVMLGDGIALLALVEFRGRESPPELLADARRAARQLAMLFLVIAMASLASGLWLAKG